MGIDSGFAVMQAVAGKGHTPWRRTGSQYESLLRMVQRVGQDGGGQEADAGLRRLPSGPTRALPRMFRFSGRESDAVCHRARAPRPGSRPSHASPSPSAVLRAGAGLWARSEVKLILGVTHALRDPRGKRPRKDASLGVPRPKKSAKISEDSRGGAKFRLFGAFVPASLSTWSTTYSAKVTSAMIFDHRMYAIAVEKNALK
jgi:hypothetical protein